MSKKWWHFRVPYGRHSLNLRAWVKEPTSEDALARLRRDDSIWDRGVEVLGENSDLPPLPEEGWLRNERKRGFVIRCA